MTSHKNCRNVVQYIFGKGSSSQLQQVLAPHRSSGNGSAVVVVDHFFKKQEMTARLGMEPKDIYITLDSTNEPYADYINAIMADLRKDLNGKLPCAIVGVGGGCAMDIAKIISVLLTNPGPVEDYQGWDIPKNPAVFKVGMPTISGTGAEGTRTAVLTSKIRKLGINSDFSVYDQIILDPDFMATVPKEQFFWTAMDCYIHDVESLRGSMIDEMSTAFAQKSLELVRDVFLNKMDHGKLMVASYLGGCAVANSNVGICHPLSYGLSLVLGLHHGIANCIAFDKLGEYYKDEVVEFRQMMKRFNVDIPRNVMKDVTDEQFDRMAEATLKNEKPLTNAFGPDWKKIFSKDKVIALLRQM